MRVMEPYVGENVAESCRRAYFELMKNDEPIILYFNDTTIMFTRDSEGIHHKGNDIDTIKLERIWGMSNKELYDSSTPTKKEGGS